MSDIHDFNPSVYWVVAGKHYNRKTDALIASNNNEHKVTFNYYNDQFSQYNWLEEPTESFEKLCTQRAHQLRDTSKYLRLWYSGGADSHTVLMTFLFNNIYIDEIVMVRASPIDDFDSEACRETNLRSIPFVKGIKHLIPKTKISFVNITAKQYLDHYKSSDWQMETTVYDFADDPGILLGSRKNLDKYTDLIMHDGIVELTGGDKPKIVRQDGLYYAPIIDSVFSYLYWANCKEFFTTPEMPALHAKQCHKLKEILTRRYPTNEDVTHEIYNAKTMDAEFKKEWYYCCRLIINYEVDFGKGWSLTTPKNQCRINDAMAKNPELLKYFMGGLKEIQPDMSYHWKKFDAGISGIMSDAYCIGK